MTDPEEPSPYAERLHKLLAHAGIGSRRACEAFIREGRVKVDGLVVREMGVRVDPRRQRIVFDDSVVRFERRVSYALHKPKGILCTNADEMGRARAIDLLPGVTQRVYPVGRLDKDSEGLLLLTNDGALALRVTHPRYGVPKTYDVWVRGTVSEESLAVIRKGVRLAEGWARLAQVRVIVRHAGGTRLQVVAEEGMNREIRRVMAKVDHPVSRLVRVAIGPVELGNLAPGRYRALTREEVEALKGPRTQP